MNPKSKFPPPPLVAQRKVQPVAPPAYRPQPLPKVLQTKMAVQPKLAAPSFAKPAPSRAMVMQRPVSIPCIVQPKIEVAKNNGKYEVKGRPAFQSHVKKTMVENWNKEHQPKLVVKGLNLTYEGLDKCHKLSWSDIREWIEGYVNQQLTTQQFIHQTNKLYGPAANTTDPEWKTMNGVRAKLIFLVEHKNWSGVPSAVATLGSTLNSATPNLRLDKHHVNIRIQSDFDPNMIKKPDGKFCMTPHSKELRKDLADQMSSPSRTPGESRVFSSSFDSPVPLGSMTPDSRAGLAPK